jgi:hypothetical protein
MFRALGWSVVLNLFLQSPGIAGEIVFVDSSAQGSNTGESWANAYNDLQHALHHAATVGVGAVWVADGTYKPGPAGGSRSLTFDLVGGVRVYGGFLGGETSLTQRRPLVNRAVLSGDLNGDDSDDPSPSNCCFSHGSPGCVNDECQKAVCEADSFCCRESWDRNCVMLTQCLCGDLCSPRCDNSYHVVTAGASSTGAVLDGFFIVGGNANGLEPREKNGGGLFVESGPPDVVNCVFHDNHAERLGGALYARAAVRVVNATFVGNEAAQGGGVFLESAAASFANCVFSGNDATEGGGMALAEANAGIAQCTFSVNTARSGGGLRSLRGSRPRIGNSIFWGNSDNGGDGEAAQIRPDPSSVVTLLYSDVQGYEGTIPGVGILSADPLFVNDAGPDFLVGTPDDDVRLSPGSPCIDAGGNGEVPSDGTDLDADGNRAESLPLDREGQARFFDDPRRPNTGDGTAPIVDLGAFEVAGDCNENGTLDDKDVSTGFSADCNRNNIPDECEIDRDSTAPGGPFFCTFDCDSDCDNNGTPDTCQPDADADGIINLCDQCPDTPPDAAVDDRGCSLPGACCFAADLCFEPLSDAGCAAIKGRFLGYGLTCDTDSDGDGSPGCADGCPGDPLKSEPGVCGCGVPETDTDSDGVPNCVDRCPIDDPDDSDGDGLCDSKDPCPMDSSGDSDGDGICDSEDRCPLDNPDDRDGDGLCNSQDQCPDDPDKGAPGVCGCGVSDDDDDEDGVVDCADECAGTPAGTPVDDLGCPALGACCFRIGICVPNTERDDCWRAGVGGFYQGNRTLCAEGCAFPGDLERDSDVDKSDFPLFLDCFLGLGVSVSDDCILADFDRNAGVDLKDVAGLQNAFTGPRR